MKLEKLIIDNFRGYRERQEILFDDLTALIGPNDAGKSTILEALDIFFHEGKSSGQVKIDKSDKNIFNESDEIIIGVAFSNYPESLVVDTTYSTSLKEEYLLNDEGLLEIQKTFKNGKVTNTSIIANYPILDELQDIHSLTIAKLRKIVNDNGLEVEDNRVSSLLRKAIFNNYDNLELARKEVRIDKEGSKQIWNSLQNYLPIYSLFQSDRKNEDKDSEIQEPMKAAIKEVLKTDDLMKKLNDVYLEVKKTSEELAALTLDKLEEMNPEIAQELSPVFQKPQWESVFKFGLDSDKDIPLNKRGSGVRRLVLLNFFRAEAERRKNERNVPNVIYAFEEPETSQHPTHQKLLIESFIELSKHDINQIIFTTHSPEIAKMLPTKSLRLVEPSEKSKVCMPDDDILNKIVNTLGVLPSIELSNVSKVKVAICVEGKNDIEFLKKINRTIPELSEICDLERDEVIFLPMGGSTLQYWINNQYLNKLKLSQVHIYDSDIGSSKPHKYKKYVDIINSRDRSIAFETTQRELENYITPKVLEIKWENDLHNTNFDEWDKLDVPLIDAELMHRNSDSEKTWQALKEEKRKQKISKSKNRINSEYVELLTKDILEEFNIYEEIKNWFESINSMIE